MPDQLDRESIEDRFRRAARAASGYLELARGQRDAGADDTSMRMAAVRELQRLTDDDDFIEAAYDADMREQHERERMGNDDAT